MLIFFNVPFHCCRPIRIDYVEIYLICLYICVYFEWKRKQKKWNTLKNDVDKFASLEHKLEINWNIFVHFNFFPSLLISLLFVNYHTFYNSKWSRVLNWKTHRSRKRIYCLQGIRFNIETRDNRSIAGKYLWDYVVNHWIH